MIHMKNKGYPIKHSRRLLKMTCHNIYVRKNASELCSHLAEQLVVMLGQRSWKHTKRMLREEDIIKSLENDGRLLEELRNSAELYIDSQKKRDRMNPNSKPRGNRPRSHEPLVLFGTARTIYRD